MSRLAACQLLGTKFKEISLITTTFHFHQLPLLLRLLCYMQLGANNFVAGRASWR